MHLLTIFKKTLAIFLCFAVFPCWSFADSVQVHDPKMKYMGVVYTTSGRSFIRQATDLETNLIRFEECSLQVSPTSSAFEGHVIHTCSSITENWLPANQYVIERFNKIFTTYLKESIDESNKRGDGSKIVAPIISLSSLIMVSMFLEDARAPQQSTLKRAGYGALSIGFAALSLFGVYALKVAWEEDLPSIETNLDRKRPQLESELSALGAPETEFLAMKIYKMIRSSLERSLETMGFTPNA